MARYTVTVTVDGAKQASVEKKMREAFGKDLEIAWNAEKVKTAETRAERFGEAEGLVDEAKSIVEELKDEMEQWYESIPENLQGGDKATEVEEAKDALEELQGELENLTFDVSFPSMF